MRKFVMFIILAIILILSTTTVFAAQPQEGPPGLERAIAVQEKHNPQLLSKPGVEGTAVGLTAEGKHVIKIFVEKEGLAGLPASLDGIPVEVEKIGKITALAPPQEKGNPLSTTTRWTRPVPIGVSTGNAKECSAGTIGARVEDSSGTFYALSNNHVYARENKAAIGEEVLQPGLYDTNCVYDANNHLGELSDFVKLYFNGTANTVDAAIAKTTSSLLGNATPSNGYGTPSLTTTSPALLMAVQKYGRTTQLTKGTIAGINWSGYVSYSSGTAYFTKQFVVYSPRKAFVKPGDSGSLVVNTSRNPVGLLFAGDSSGRYGICNDINNVLNAFGVTVDGN